MAEACTSTENAECPPAKKIKLGCENDENDTSLCFSNFMVTRILQNNCTRKQICIEGTFKDRDEPAIVLLEKKTFPIDEPSLKSAFFNEDATMRKLFSNDIYRNYVCFPETEHNGLNVTVIHPATPKHIKKYSRKELFIVDETYDLYKKITLPYIESSQFSLTWITNILEHKAEQNNIVYEDRDQETGFVLVKDIRWDGQLQTLKLIALPFQNIRSIRELNASHLPLLKNIRDNASAAISKQFDVPVSKLRVYFHYQPSYYYLHVHFSYLMFDAPGIRVEKAHLLSTVISNIELLPDYYTKAVLSFVVAEEDPLFTQFRDEGIIKTTKSESNDA